MSSRHRAARGAKRRGAGFARRAYGLRCVGLAMGFLLVETVFRLQHADARTQLVVLAYCFGWPHLAFAMTRWSARADLTERRNLFIDSFAGGFIVVAMKLTWLPSTLVLLMFMMNNVAAGGIRLLARGVAMCCVGSVFGMLVYGFRIDWGSVPATTLASAPMLLIYPLSLGVVTYRTAMKLSEHSRALKLLSEHDALTGLLNRATLATHLSSALIQARKSGQRLNVLFIDLDDFKVINDTLGHKAGDELLTAVAARLVEATGTSELIGRYGGDEFVIVSTLQDRNSLKTLASRLVEMAHAPLQLGSSLVRPSLSVGTASFPDHADDEQTLLNKADTAMYAAKSRGGRSVSMYGKTTLAQ